MKTSVLKHATFCYSIYKIYIPLSSPSRPKVDIKPKKPPYPEQWTFFCWIDGSLLCL